MEELQKEFWAMMESVAVAVEEFIQDVGEAVETIAEGWQQEILTDLDRLWQEWAEPMLDEEWEIEEALFAEFFQDTDTFTTPYIEPTSERLPACRGCQHYHGHRYGGNLLVCGMHPYGWDGDACPDWESEPS